VHEQDRVPVVVRRLEVRVVRAEEELLLVGIDADRERALGGAVGLSQAKSLPPTLKAGFP
jgi:hypothetical protein